MEQEVYNKKYQQLIKHFIVTAIFLLFIVSVKQLITSRQTEVAADTTYIINAAGRQRMLSQKMIKNIILINQDDVAVDQRIYKEDLKNSFSTWTETHEELMEISQKTRLLQRKSSVLHELFVEVEPSYLRLVDGVEAIIVEVDQGLEGTEEFNSLLQVVLQQEAIYLEKMDQIVSKYEKQARDSIYSSERTHQVIFLLIIVLLIFAIVSVFRPLLNQLKNAHAKVSESNKNLVEIIQFMKGAFFLADLEGNILFMNEDAELLVVEEDQVNSSLNLATSIDWMDFNVEELLKQAEIDNSRLEGLEALIKDKEGSLVSVMISAFATNYNEKRVIVLNLFDFTVQKRAEELLKEAAVKDELTGLYNRHILERILAQEFQKADLYGIPISAVLLDLDNFKTINDQYGHPVGDAILKLTAETIKNNIRRSDYAIRIGGEEILIFMANSDKTAAMTVAEKIRCKLNEIVHPKAGKVTASFGVVERQAKEEYLYLYKRVDKVLYEAKKAGKNRVKVF